MLGNTASLGSKCARKCEQVAARAIMVSITGSQLPETETSEELWLFFLLTLSSSRESRQWWDKAVRHVPLPWRPAGEPGSMSPAGKPSLPLCWHIVAKVHQVHSKETVPALSFLLGQGWRSDPGLTIYFGLWSSSAQLIPSLSLDVNGAILDFLANSMGVISSFLCY